MITPYKFNPIFLTYSYSTYFEGSVRLNINGKVYYMNAKDYYDSINLDIAATIYMVYCALHLIACTFMVHFCANDMEANVIITANMMSIVATKEYISPIFVMSLTLWYILCVYYLFDNLFHDFSHIVSFLVSTFHILISHFIFINFDY